MKKIPALLKSSSGEASKPEPSAKTTETSTKMRAALLGGVSKSLPDNAAEETAENITGKTQTTTPKSVRAKKASGADLTEAASILGDIYKLMKEDRKDFLDSKKRIKANQRDVDSDEQKQHKEILSALGRKGGGTGEKPGKGKKSKEESSKYQAIGQLLGYLGLAGTVAVDKAVTPKPAPPAPAPSAPPPNGGGGGSAAGGGGSTPAPAPSGGQTATPASRDTQTSQPAPSAAPTAGPATAAKQESTVTPPSGGEYGIAKASIERHEGRRNKPYKDSKGLWTIGVGHLIGDGKSLPPEMNREFSDKEIDDMFAKDYEHHEKAATGIPGYQNLNENGKAALIDLTFNMGPSWYKKWPNFTEQLKNGDVEGAAKNLEGSDWYKQVGRRGPDVVNLLRSSKATGGPAAQAKEASAAPHTASSVPAESKPPGEGGKPRSAAPAGSAPPGNPGDLSSATQVQSGVDVKGIQPTLAGRVAAAAADFKAKTGKKLMITSGFRSNEKQKELWDAKLAANGGNVEATRKMVAEPAAPLGNGRGSQHMIGLAIDINSKGESGLNVLAGPRTKSTGWLESFGLTRPVNNEDWHVQLLGTPATPDNPDKPGAPVTVVSKDGATDPSTGEKKPLPKAAAIADAKPTTTPPAAPTAMPSPPPAPSGGMKLAAASTQNNDMKEQMAENSKVTNVVNNNVSSTSSSESEDTSNVEVENDEPSYLRKVLYG